MDLCTKTLFPIRFDVLIGDIMLDINQIYIQNGWIHFHSHIHTQEVWIYPHRLILGNHIKTQISNKIKPNWFRHHALIHLWIFTHKSNREGDKQFLFACPLKMVAWSSSHLGCCECSHMWCAIRQQHNLLVQNGTHMTSSYSSAANQEQLYWRAQISYCRICMLAPHIECITSLACDKVLGRIPLSASKHRIQHQIASFNWGLFPQEPVNRSSVQEYNKSSPWSSS